MSRSLSQQVGILTVGRVLAYAVMFFVPLVNTRMLTVEHYGYYRQFWLIFETLSPILILGFPRSLMYYFPRAESDEQKSIYATQTIVFLVAMSLVAWLVYSLMATYLGEGMGALVRAFYWRLVAFTMFMMVSQYMEQLWVAERRVVGQSVYHAVTSILQASIVMAIALFTRDVSAMIWGLAIFAGFKFLFALGYTAKRYTLALNKISLASMKEQLSFAAPLGAASIALVLLSQTDKFIISRFLGREEFAIYTIGAFQVPFVNIIRGSITNVTFPMMAKYQKQGDFAAILALYKRALLKTSVLFFPIFSFLVVSADPFIRSLFEEEYLRAIPVFAVYMFLFLRSSVETGQVLQVFKRNDFVLKVFAAGFAANLVLSIGLFQWIGRLGVPIGTVITMYLVNIINLMKASSLLQVGFFDMLPLGALGRRLFVALIPAGGLWVAYHYYSVDNPLELVVACGLYSLVYFAICQVNGFLTIADLRSLVGRSPDK